MKLSFHPITEAEFAITEAMKRATVTDAMGNAALFDEWFPPERPFSEYMYQRLGFDPESCLFVMMDDAIIGHLHLKIREDGSGYLNDIYLKPAWRGQNLGAQLEAHAVRFFRKHGATFAQLQTNPQQPKLVAFYQRMGWKLGEPSVHGLVWMEKELA